MTAQITNNDFQVSHSIHIQTLRDHYVVMGDDDDDDDGDGDGGGDYDDDDDGDGDDDDNDWSIDFT